MSFDINGKIALVTGANRGIGKAITEKLLERDALKVYAAVRKPDSMQPLVDKYGVDRVAPVELDLSKPDTITRAAEIASDVHLVVNNGGVLTQTGAISGDAEKNLKFEMEVNVFGFLRLANAFAPVLKANGGGALVQLNSIASIRTATIIGTYAASKAASYSLTQTLREQLAEQGTQVLSVHPGPIDTDMTENIDMEKDTPETVAQGVVDALREGDFHLFPDKKARDLWQQYESFAREVVEADMAKA